MDLRHTQSRTSWGWKGKRSEIEWENGDYSLIPIGPIPIPSKCFGVWARPLGIHESIPNSAWRRLVEYGAAWVVFFGGPALLGKTGDDCWKREVFKARWFFSYCGSGV